MTKEAELRELARRAQEERAALERRIEQQRIRENELKTQIQNVQHECDNYDDGCVIL